VVSPRGATHGVVCDRPERRQTNRGLSEASGSGPAGVRESGSTDRNGGLDVLRVCAAALVFMVHSLILQRYGSFDSIAIQGRLGVYLFFALSGYLVFKPFALGHPTVLRYYRRRLIRIVPAYLVALLIIALLNGPPDGWRRLITFTQAWGAEPPQLGFSVTWTLSVEMTFYAVLPLLALVLGQGAWRRVTLLAVFSFLSLQLIGNPYRQDAAWLALWGFAPGMAVAILGEDLRFPPWLALVGIAAAVDALMIESPPLMGIAGGLIIAGCTSLRIRVPFAREVADASYSFYLLHLAVILAFFNAGWQGWPAVFVALTVTLALSLAISQLIERPIQKVAAGGLRSIAFHRIDRSRSGVARLKSAPASDASRREV
jgi:peptidoglycan/LPS O-acetylase OafA/YrhL